MKFIIGYFSTNGYRCSCCRATYQHHEIEEFKNKKEAIEFCKAYDERYKDDSDEHQIEYCYPIGDIIYGTE